MVGAPTSCRYLFVPSHSSSQQQPTHSSSDGLNCKHHPENKKIIRGIEYIVVQLVLSSLLTATFGHLFYKKNFLRSSSTTLHSTTRYPSIQRKTSTTRQEVDRLHCLLSLPKQVCVSLYTNRPIVSIFGERKCFKDEEEYSEMCSNDDIYSHCFRYRHDFFLSTTEYNNNYKINNKWWIHFERS